jgi:integrase
MGRSPDAEPYQKMEGELKKAVAKLLRRGSHQLLSGMLHGLLAYPNYYLGLRRGEILGMTWGQRNPTRRKDRDGAITVPISRISLFTHRYPRHLSLSVRQTLARLAVSLIRKVGLQ